ncbi:unnamed protein product [Gordionus sp. m RMFG-2023]
MSPRNVSNKPIIALLKTNSNIGGDGYDNPIDLVHHYFLYRSQILINAFCKVMPILALFGIFVNTIVIVYLIKLIRLHPLEYQVRNVEYATALIRNWLRFQSRKIVGALNRLTKICEPKYFSTLNYLIKIKQKPRNYIETLVGDQIASISAQNMNTFNCYGNDSRRRICKRTKESLSKIYKDERKESSSYIILVIFCDSVECLANKPFEHVRKILSVREKNNDNLSFLIQNNKMKFRHIYDNLRFFTTPPTFESTQIIIRPKKGTIKKFKQTLIGHTFSIKETNSLNKVRERENIVFRPMHISYDEHRDISANSEEINLEAEAFIEFFIKNLSYSKAFKLYLSYGWNFYMAKLQLPLTLILINFNFFLTVLYTMNRFICTTYELEYDYWCNVNKTLLSIMVCFLLSFLLYLPTTFNYKVVVIRLSSYFLFKDYPFDQNTIYHLLSNDKFPVITYYSFKKRKLGFGSSRTSKKTWLIYEVSRELVCKFIVLGIMGYLINSLANEMASKRWLFDKKRWNSIVKTSFIMFTSNIKVEGTIDTQNGINSGNQNETDGDTKWSKVMANHDSVKNIVNDKTSQEILNCDNLSSRHCYNWNRKFFLTLLRVFWAGALIFNMPISLLEITGKFWQNRVSNQNVDFIILSLLIANLLSITLTFPVTLAIMIFS